MKRINFQIQDKPYRWLIFACAVALLVGCGGEKKKKKNECQGNKTHIMINDTLRTRLTEFSLKPRVRGQFAFQVYDLTADKLVYGCNEKLALPSASCLKLLTGVAGLHLLGTHHTYTTSIYTRGNLSNGVLQGDVTFKGSLDPQLLESDFSMFTKALRRKGINKIGGKVFIDLVIQDPVKSEEHWYPWDLSFSRYGIFYKGAPRILNGFKVALRQQGLAVADSQVVLGPLPKGSVCIYRFARSLDPVLQRMWKNSSNTQSTGLLYTIGHRVNPYAYPPAAGVEYLRKFLREDIGLLDTTLVIHDGCGLCTYNRLSPEALTRILTYGYQHQEIFQHLWKHLSISGVDGTLKHEVSSPKIQGRVRGKTGTLSHPFGISSLAGYCTAKDGHLLAFAMMQSEMSVLDARVLQRKFCEVLVQP